MQIKYAAATRIRILEIRGIDMARANEVFAGPTLTVEDDRHDYGETRFITIGLLGHRMVVMVWTRRRAVRRIISLRKANDREQTFYRSRLV